MKLLSLFVMSGLISSACFAYSSRGVEGLTIPNAHELSASQSKGRVIRGSQPNSKVNELGEIGVTDVLIFKNEVKTEVRDEASALKRMGIQVHKIPFQWKDIEDSEAACRQVIEAEILLEKIARQKNKSIFFHCTAGEDRTGLLAGVFRVSAQGWMPEQAFQNEMCRNGFADGNPNKPAAVAATVRKELYPIFRMAIEAIKVAEEKGTSLNPNDCNRASVSALRAPYPRCR